MQRIDIRRWAPVTALCAAMSLGACVGEIGGPGQDELVEPAAKHADGPSQESIDRGRDIWFNNTYGGEQFFYWLANAAPPEKRIAIGFENVINTPRAQRFDEWGVINDPDCEADPNGGPDICPDPAATGVVGMRKSQPFGPAGPTLYGASCASCHAGFDPLDPPADPNDPSWDNIHATIGNMHVDIAKVFSANLHPMDPRRPMFDTWPKGTVDTTALFNDGIMNPGTITAFWEHDDRPTFHVHRTVDGETTEGFKLNNGQGGEDSFGGDLAALRVYINIGVCFEGCVAPAVATNTEVDVATCKAVCEPTGQWPTDQDLEDMTAFLGSFEAPQFPGYPGNGLAYLAGAVTFKKNCEHCHDNSSWDAREVLSDDEITLFLDDPNVTNTCRALTSNWEPGKIWGQFTSDEYQARVAAGDRGYRTMPLAGIWSTAPFTHNNNIGELAPANGSLADRAAAFRNSMLELMSYRDLYMNVLENDLYTQDENGNPVLLAPAGTPHHYVYSAGKCFDLYENRGHYFGAELPNWQKEALIYYLRYQ